MDNARIHKALKIYLILDSIKIFYSAPYSPFLNLIDEVYGKWKQLMRKEAHRSKLELLKASINSLRTLLKLVCRKSSA
jgi:uncharacterized protein with ParB-like and HNH nuclease domain